MAEKCEGRKIKFKSTIQILKLDLSFAGDNSRIDFRSSFRQLMLCRSLGLVGTSPFRLSARPKSLPCSVPKLEYLRNGEISERDNR
jgi:hypothetical protein